MPRVGPTALPEGFGLMEGEYRLFLRGHVPGKKNAWKRSAKGGMHLPSSVRSEIDSLVLQARAQWKREPLEAAAISASFYVKDGARDLDNAYTCIQDVLVKAGVIRNDTIKRVAAFSACAIISTVEESVTVIVSEVETE